MKKCLVTIALLLLCFVSHAQNNQRARDLGIHIGIFPSGKYNAITDVPGVKVGHTTIIKGDDIRTGVTAILPHDGNIFQQKVPAAIFVGNGFGKLMGITQVEELGNMESPIILTNTLSIAAAAEAVINYTLELPGNEKVRSVNAIVGETNDGWLNDIRGMHVSKNDVLSALQAAKVGAVAEGNVGAGTGTMTLGFKGGIGTASRITPQSTGGYMVGVLVQSNFGGILQVNGVPVGLEMQKHMFSRYVPGAGDGSCMIVVMTDAPLDSRNLKRLAARAMLGLGKTGGIASNGSGDYVIAVSTSEKVRIAYQSNSPFVQKEELRNEQMDVLFEAVIEATEEAIINSLLAAEDMSGYNGNKASALPKDELLKILKKYNRSK
jgi:D-aminopeptidase